MKVYKITQGTNYNDIFLDIVVGEYKGSEDEIRNLANSNLCAILQADGLHITFGDESFIISDDEKDKYYFEICTKELPPPISVNKLKKMPFEEVKSLLFNEAYMTYEDDYKKVDWSLSQVYLALKNANPSLSNFSFSSLSYGIEEL